MCTAVIYKNFKSQWPFIISFNRDEFFSRKTLSPKRHWNKYPHILAGKDLKKGGTWFGVNDYGIFVCILNRNANKNIIKKFNTSRGTLVLDILKEKNLEKAKNKISTYFTLKNYNGFNIVISDYKNSYYYTHDSSSKKINITKIIEGISVITNESCNNFKEKKIKEYYNYFKKIPSPNPEKNNWNEWSKLMIKKINLNKVSLNQNSFFNMSNLYGLVSCSQLALSTNNEYIYRYSYKHPFDKNFRKINE
jgi:uncharacterized protein with NRDE domain|tara:strand:- start:93 stop:839 length:747 start_codon:yes stop_codon:yes gene_type:complete